jgi:phage tail sheath gpL-like
MSLADIASITIAANSGGIKRTSFGVPLIAAYHTEYVDRVREYSKLSEMVDDGFATTSPAYLAAVALKSQSPSVRKWKVGRRALAMTQTVDITPTVTTEGFTYQLSIGDESIEHTVGASATVATICDALVIAINALSGAFTCTDGTTKVTVAANSAGVLFRYHSFSREFTIKDVTADPGIATDLTAIRAADDDWYGLILDSQGAAEVAAAAAAIETLEKILVFNTADSVCRQSGTSDILSTLETSAYARTAGLFHTDLDGYASAAWMGQRFARDPGSDTWAYKTLAGIPADVLTTAEQGYIAAKQGSYYVEIAGRNVTIGGKVASGEWIDVVRGRDWLVARLREEIFALLANSEKLPYTDAGVAAVVAVIQGVLDDAVNRGFLAASPEPTVTAPDVADVSSVDKAARLLPDIEFSATLAGAVHSLDITGTVSV